MISRKKSIWRGIRVLVAGVSVFYCMSFQPVMAQSEEEGHLIPHEVGKLQINGGITAVLQGTSGIADKGDVTDLSYTLDLGLEAEIIPNGKVVIALEAGNGNGVNVIDDDIEPFLSVPNYDVAITEEGGIVTPSIAQAYFEGTFMGGLLGINIGKLDVHSLYDENAYANDETDQFMAGIFTRYPGSIWPELDHYYAPGLAVTISPAELVEFRLIGANGVESGFENVFDNAYIVAHVNIMPGLLGRDGNYRFHYIYDARDYTEISSGDIAENTGFGLSFDQEVSDGIGLFARYAMQDDGIDENVVKSALSGGVSLNGSLWNREEDVLGIAYGILSVNDKTTDISVLSNSGDEGHIEVYYKLGISDHITVTPDIQVVTNAGGDADIDPITVYGVRAQLNF